MNYTTAHNGIRKKGKVLLAQTRCRIISLTAHRPLQPNTTATGSLGEAVAEGRLCKVRVLKRFEGGEDRDLGTGSGARFGGSSLRKRAHGLEPGNMDKEGFVDTGAHREEEERRLAQEDERGLLEAEDGMGRERRLVPPEADDMASASTRITLPTGPDMVPALDGGRQG